MGGALEIEKGALWELRAEDLWLVANSDNLSRFLQLPSELCQKAADEDGGAREWQSAGKLATQGSLFGDANKSLARARSLINGYFTGSGLLLPSKFKSRFANWECQAQISPQHISFQEKRPPTL